MKRIAILGSTGSIGKQALEVIARHPDRFSVAALTAHSNAEALFEQVRRFRPSIAGLAAEPQSVPADLRFCEWRFGEDCLRAAAEEVRCDAVLVSVVGFAGLAGVMAALDAGRTVLLANKEPLVAAGALVTGAAREAGASLLPVDSEHSAIFQCLQGAAGNPPERLYLTASGGPFRDWSREAMAQATVEQALAHPNWAMGPKITVDSASMMNKALEVIEARWLFGVPPERIEVLVHPQSVIHSMVEFADGAVIAQLGTPDMRLPILYALAYPQRLPTGGDRLDFARMGRLTFEEPDPAKFPPLRLAYEALKAGGTAAAVLNGANEAAVQAFLARRIRFGRIAALAEEILQRVPVTPADSLEAVRAADLRAREWAARLLA
ncbi:MAG: 1-deoxy-D-xylulose-5-phosphate reductoisomerase [Clostridia bacterium]|nr:1-deoxy-D-xylulose-5-phosphate reductoisomerase [Clostridia bacterium]